MTPTTSPEPIVIFNSPDEFKTELVDRLWTHVSDEVKDMLSEELQASMGMSEYPYEDYLMMMMTYVETYLNISLR